MPILSWKIDFRLYCLTYICESQQLQCFLYMFLGTTIYSVQKVFFSLHKSISFLKAAGKSGCCPTWALRKTLHTFPYYMVMKPAALFAKWQAIAEVHGVTLSQSQRRSMRLRREPC